MLPLNEKTLRASFVNTTRKELSDLTLPADFDTIDFDRLDYLGWRDRRIARRAYAVIPVPALEPGLGDGSASPAPELVGIMFKQAEATPRSRAQCSLCQDVQLPNDVVLFAARRTGHAGRNGDTVASLVCADFECSANVRKLPPSAYIGFDREAARADRIASLRQRVAAFARAATSAD
ncbi:FBP domain-containing protein [Herbiconiux liukaitaii]|uniref:FBP domain-containing protein n=1 Tax=Herbiconiux liukaitaii TaxID=3342799 RepID=UPI0035B8E297